MNFKTHIAFALLSGLLLVDYFPAGNKILFLAFVLIGSSLPDIDNASSKIGQRLKPISTFIQLFLGHRGIFHSIFLAILMPGLVYFYFSKAYGIALFAGYISHLFIDALTKKGVNFLNPFLNLRMSGFIETGSILEFALFVLIAVIDAVLIAKVFVMAIF